MPPCLRISEGDRTVYRIDQIDLSFDQILPSRRVGILEIGHKDIGAAVQRIDHHLAVGWAGDLDAAVLKVRRDRRYLPFAVADHLGLGQEIGLPTGVELALDCGAPGETTPSLRTQPPWSVMRQIRRLRFAAL